MTDGPAEPRGRGIFSLALNLVAIITGIAVLVGWAAIALYIGPIRDQAIRRLFSAVFSVAGLAAAATAFSLQSAAPETTVALLSTRWLQAERWLIDPRPPGLPQFFFSCVALVPLMRFASPLTREWGVKTRTVKSHVAESATLASMKRRNRNHEGSSRARRRQAAVSTKRASEGWDALD